MSASLLGLGFRADMGTCIRKLVLLKLVDACEEDGTRIFPAVATVARAAQCSERQVQREIRAFLAAGLLHLVREGGRGQGSTTEYRLDLDLLMRLAREGWAAVVAASEPDPSSGGDPDDAVDEVPPPKGDTQSPLDAAGKGDTGGVPRVTPETAKGDIWSHPTPPYPSIDPSEERGRARAPGQAGAEPETLPPDDPKKFERRVKRLAYAPAKPHQPWPGWAVSSTEWTVKRFAVLSDAERAEAERYGPAYVAHLGAKALSLGTYFAERKWRDLPEDVRSPPASTVVDAPAFGPVWGAVRMRWLLTQPPQQGPALPPTSFLARQLAQDDATGRKARLERQARYGWPDVAAMHAAAAERRRGVTRPLADEALKALMEPVPVGSPVWEAWRAEHARRGWPWLPDPGGQRAVYFPAGGPSALGVFEAAIQERGDDDGGSQAAE